MRVIAGRCKSLHLKSIDGINTRPTTDRIKETLFNMIGPVLNGCVFLDLFAGSGGIGIEALSRGARTCYFIEKDKKAADCIRKNLTSTKLTDSGILLVSDVNKAITNFAYGLVFDFVFMDPPYNHGLERDALSLLKSSDCITSDTQIIVEASLNTDFSYAEELGFKIEKEKKYKTNKHVFLIRR